MTCMTANQELDTAWRQGDAVNNVTALLRYYERKRDEEPWWCFWGRWHWHAMVSGTERERDRVYRENGIVGYTLSDKNHLTSVVR